VASLVVSLTCPDMSVTQMRDSVAEFLEPAQAGGYQFEHSALQTRSVDPTILVSLASASSAVLTALVTGVLQMASSRRGKSGSISIQTPDGVNISLPLNSGPEDVDQAVSLLSQVSAAHFSVSDAVGE
jgi:hypothetical protein